MTFARLYPYAILGLLPTPKRGVSNIRSPFLTHARPHPLNWGHVFLRRNLPSLPRLTLEVKGLKKGE